jgi:uncharacterized protein YdiU (UPF0061 family)
MTLQLDGNNLHTNPEWFSAVLGAIKQKIPNFANDKLEAIKDLPIVAELQTASIKMCEALDSEDIKVANTNWHEFNEIFEQVKTAYHEAAHAVVGYRLKSKLNRKILRVCINFQKAVEIGLETGFVEFEKPVDPHNQIEAQAKLAVILAGYLNEPIFKPENSSFQLDEDIPSFQLGGIIPEGDEKQKARIIRHWFPKTAARERAMEEATREATWSQQQDAISALARVLLLEPELELNEQAAQEFLSSRPELNGN